MAIGGWLVDWLTRQAEKGQARPESKTRKQDIGKEKIKKNF